MKHIKNLLLVAATSVILVSCIEKYESGYMPTKPEEVAMEEYLNGYGVLKACVNRSTNPNFKMGAGVTANDFLKKELSYSLTCYNFDEITANSAMMYGSIVKNDSSMDFSTIKNFIEAAKNAGITIYGHTLVWHSMQNGTYLNGIIAPIPRDVQTGTLVIADFESNSINDTYPMTSNGTATVVDDPAGQSGKVLNIGGPAVFTYPIFHVTLSPGLRLGNCKTLTMDFYGTGSTGLYGSGMRLAINDISGAAVYGGPATFGCPNGDWGRGLIILNFANLNLTEDQKALTEFDLIVGSGTGSGNYYIDNITVQWETGEYIRTPEEKKGILTNALDTWIQGMMEACDGYVTAWDVVNEPMDDTIPGQLKTGIGKTQAGNEFYWQDYLGKDYAVDAFKLAAQYGNVNDKLFINDNNLEYNLDKCQGLIDYVAYIESKGARVDGIGTQMHINTNSDTVKIAEMFTLLAATGKLIKISELYVRIGDGVVTDSVTDDDYKAQAKMYKYVAKKYFELVPASQRYGITVWSPKDSNTDAAWLPNEPIGLWTSGYIRKRAYAGFADGLQ